MKILITGNLGYVGPSVIRLLREQQLARPSETSTVGELGSCGLEEVRRAGMSIERTSEERLARARAHG